MTEPTTDVRAEVEAWAAEKWDPDLELSEWWRRLAEAGYTSPTLAEGAGGKGWTRSQANEAMRALAEAGAVGPPSGLGIMLAAPTIADHGSDDQIDRYIPKILDGSASWCQLFSEPGAGSDLAGLQCKAERDGDEWVVTGQKVWTSGGHISQMGMLIARTDPDAPKHQGITYFAIEMDQPGIDVRPLREMTGRALFNEVFIDEARVAHDAIIGGQGNGWRVANTTLAYERSHLGAARVPIGTATPGPIAGDLARRAGDFSAESDSEGGVPAVGTKGFWHLVDLARKNGGVDDPVLRQDLIGLYTLVEVSRMLGQWARGGGKLGAGYGNLAKLGMSELFRRTRDVGNRVIGADGMLDRPASATGGFVQEITMFSPGPSIYGGTDQVQRNIIGERVLGLPKEPGPDKSTPFKDLVHN